MKTALTISAFQLVSVLACVLLAGCAAPKSEKLKTEKLKVESIMPPSPFIASSFDASARATVPETRSISIPPAPRVMGWTWDYTQPMPVENIVFEFFSTTNLAQPNWTKHGETNQPVYWFNADKDQEYFIVRASNTLTHLVSEWAGNQN